MTLTHSPSSPLRPIFLTRSPSSRLSYVKDAIFRFAANSALAETSYAGIKAIKVHQALERLLEVLGVAEAGRSHRAARLQPRHHGPRGEEPGCAECGSQAGAHLIE
jgi:hypothetical protein